MAIEKTTKYKVFKKYKSLDNGTTWVVVEPDEYEYVAWEQNSIDCGYIPPIIGDTGTTTGNCKTVVAYKYGPTKEFDINGTISKSSIDNVSAATSIDLGTCVTSINYGAFSDCTYLRSLIIVSGITSIGDYALRNCSSLSSLNFKGTKVQWNDIIKGIEWNDEHLKVVHCTDGDVYLECETIYTERYIDAHTGKHIYMVDHSSGILNRKKIDDADLDRYIKVDIGNCITEIGSKAFEGFYDLSAVTIPDSVVKIGYYAFSGCSSLSTFNFEGTTSQWNAITKGDNWNRNVPATVVHCTDGDVPL